MYRGRKIPVIFVGDESLPFIFVISYPYEVTDSTGLPTSVQYELLEEFERGYLDSIESLKLGIVAFIQTHDGTVRYFLYVSSVEAVSELLTDTGTQSLSLQLAAESDPDWSEYRAFMQGMHPM